MVVGNLQKNETGTLPYTQTKINSHLNMSPKTVQIPKRKPKGERFMTLVLANDFLDMTQQFHS